LGLPRPNLQLTFIVLEKGGLFLGLWAGKRGLGDKVIQFWACQGQTYFQNKQAHFWDYGLRKGVWEVKLNNFWPAKAKLTTHFHRFRTSRAIFGIIGLEKAPGRK
jgi:hypothetical protein